MACTVPNIFRDTLFSDFSHFSNEKIGAFLCFNTKTWRESNQKEHFSSTRVKKM